MGWKIDKPKARSEQSVYAVPQGTRATMEALAARHDLNDGGGPAPAAIFRALLAYGQRALDHHWKGAQKHLIRIEAKEGFEYDPDLRLALALKLALEFMDSQYHDPARRPAPYRGDAQDEADYAEKPENPCSAE